MSGQIQDGAGAPFPARLLAPGAATAGFRPAIRAEDLPPGGLRRVSFDDLDVLLAHTAGGIVAVEDRCPHMAVPLSVGRLEGCIVYCPLHHGAFDLATGEPRQMPSVGGLHPDGSPSAPWSPTGVPVRADPVGPKFEARRLTRVRRFRYFPVRVEDGVIQVAVPA
jgi:nitrite reductase/ring-hydroxylating ferredoxin subunit